MSSTIWYDINKTLTYNALFHFIVGARSTGKTYGFKKWAIESFLKTGKQFIYVRRYEPDMQESRRTFFAALLSAFPDHEFKTEGNRFLIDGKIAGFAIVLSKAASIKSVDYPEVDKICYDEFLITDTTHHYMRDEVQMFLELYQTIDRFRDTTRVFFLANASTVSNPYFIYFNLNLPRSKNGISCKNHILVELVSTPELTEKRKKSKLGSIIAGSEYERYSMDNEFIGDDFSFIEKKTENSKPFFNIYYRGVTYGIWGDLKAGRYTVSLDTCDRITYTMSLKDHSPNTMLISSLRNAENFRAFIENVKIGNVFYESLKIKNALYEIYKVVANVRGRL